MVLPVKMVERRPTVLFVPLTVPTSRPELPLDMQRFPWEGEGLVDIPKEDRGNHKQHVHAWNFHHRRVVPDEELDGFNSKNGGDQRQRWVRGGRYICINEHFCLDREGPVMGTDTQHINERNHVLVIDGKMVRRQIDARRQVVAVATVVLQQVWHSCRAHRHGRVGHDESVQSPMLPPREIES